MSAAAITLGSRIREARGSMTQYELADRVRRTRPKMRLSEARISRYERDVQVPRFSVLVAIAEETGKPLDFFRVAAGNGEQPDGEEDEEDSAAMTRAAYHLDRVGEYALADDLRSRARRQAMRRRRVLA